MTHRQVKSPLYFDANAAGQRRGGCFLLTGAALSAFRAIAQRPYFDPAWGR